MKISRDAGQSMSGEIACPDRYQAMLNQLNILSPEFLSPEFLARKACQHLLVHALP
jgi:hypothetical protein